MKKTNTVKIVLLVGVVVLISAISYKIGTFGSSATVISEMANEKVQYFTKEDLKKATNVQLDTTSVEKIYTALKQPKYWEKLGYSSVEAGEIATRFDQSQHQAIGILTDVANSDDLSLKVIMVNKPNGNTVNIGTVEEGTISENTEVSTENASNEQNEKALNNSLKQVDIKIKYEHQEIRLKYEVKSNGTVKSKYRNEFTGETVEGAQAQRTIENVLVGLDLKNSKQAEIKNYVIKKLNADPNVKQFNFKAKYIDQSKVDFQLN